MSLNQRRMIRIPRRRQPPEIDGILFFPKGLALRVSIRYTKVLCDVPDVILSRVSRFTMMLL